MSWEPSVRQPKSKPAMFTPAGGVLAFFRFSFVFKKCSG